MLHCKIKVEPNEYENISSTETNIIVKNKVTGNKSLLFCFFWQDLE